MRERNDFSQGRKKRPRIQSNPDKSVKKSFPAGEKKDFPEKRKTDERSKAYFREREPSVYKPKPSSPIKREEFRPKPAAPQDEKGRDAYKKKRSFSKNKDFRKDGGDVKRAKVKFVPRKDKYEARDKILSGEAKTPLVKRAIPVKKPRQPYEGTLRLNKYIANSGIGSRREADILIETGLVTVNGEIITTLGYKINPGDEVKCNNQTIKPEKNVYVLLNKPKDYIATTDDPFERKTVMTLVAGACKERIYPVGRLDRNTSGVLLLTNDGELTKKLTHPSYEIPKIYHVELDNKLTQEDFEKIREGVELEDGVIKVDDISFLGDGVSKKEVMLTIHSGKNRIVRRIFEHLEYTVVKLDRVSFAGLTKSGIKRGDWKFLSEQEVGYLRMLTGDKEKKKAPAKRRR